MTTTSDVYLFLCSKAADGHDQCKEKHPKEGETNDVSTLDRAHNANVIPEVVALLLAILGIVLVVVVLVIGCCYNI